MEKNKEYFCILGGGGIRGCSYTGVLRALYELNINITGWAGSSIGAVVAILHIVGYSPEEISEIFKDISLDFFKDLNFSLGRDFAISKGGNFYEWIKEKIESKFYKENYTKGKMEPVTFEKLNKNIVVFSVKLNDTSFHEFSKEKTPDVEIASAIRASVSMPGLYKPVTEGGDVLVDGDLIKCMPLWKASSTIQKKKERILEFRLEDNETKKKIENTANYLNAVYNAVSGFATDYIIETYKDKDKFDYIKINLPDNSVVDFMMSDEKKAKIAQIGYDTTINYFENIYPKKKRALFDTYYNIELMLLKIRPEIETNKIKNSYLILMELMSFLCENGKNINENIAKKIIDFKNLFKENYKISKILFIQGYTLNDKDMVLNSLERVIELVKEKTLELKD